MNPKDFTPYSLVAQTSETITLQLKKGYKILFFITFRALPLLLFIGLALAPEDIYRTLPSLLYWGLYFIIIIIVFVSFFYRYTLALTFTKSSIILRFNLCFFQWNQTELLKPTDEILIAKERGGRSVYWMFYLIQQGQKKKLFHIPVFLTENIGARNNFIVIFEQTCKLKTTIQS